MKKNAFFLLLLITAPLYSESIKNNFNGIWKLDTFLAEYPDGIIVSSETDYSSPYLGIKRLEFFSDSFIVFLIENQSYRAFYEVEENDFDNLIVNCTFKNGEKLKLKLTPAKDNGWVFLYKIPEDSFIEITSPNHEEMKKKLSESQKSLSSKEQENPVQKPSSNDTEITDVSESAPEATFIGIMKKIKD